MRHFSNIMPNFAAYLHLLVDSILTLDKAKKRKNLFSFLVLSSLIRNFADIERPSATQRALSLLPIKKTLSLWNISYLRENIAR